MKWLFTYMKFTKSRSHVWVSTASWKPGSKNVPMVRSAATMSRAWSNATAVWPSTRPRTIR
jgi:hypothetical protein